MIDKNIPVLRGRDAAFLASLVLAFVCFAADTKAALITAGGGNVAISGGTASFAGTLIDDTGLMPFSGSGGLAGKVETKVYQEPSGYLDFVYQVTNNAGSPSIKTTSIASLLTGGLGTPFTLNADFMAGTETPTDSTVHPSQVGLDSGGSVVTFGSTTSLPASATSVQLVLQTNAMWYTTGNFGIIAGAHTSNLAVPIPVPEPATAATVILGLATALGRRRRKA